MKTILIIFLFLPFFQFKSFSQSYPKPVVAQWYKACEEIETLNQNVIANKRLVGKESVRYYNCPNAIASCKFNSEVIKTGRTDINGNEIIHLKLWQDDKDKYFLLVPDFEDYPLRYCVLNFYDGIKAYTFGSGVSVRYVRRSDVIINDTEDAKISSFDGSTLGDEFIRKKEDKYNSELNVFYRTYSNQYPAFGAVSDDVVKKHEENVTKRLLDELSNLSEAVYAYNERALSKIQGKTYSDLINEIQEGDAFIFQNLHFDSLRVKLVKNSAGQAEEIIFHLPFIKDNKYYDQEKFYVKAKKNKNGYFSVQEVNKDLNLTLKIMNTIIIPFEGRLLFCNLFNNGIGNNNLTNPTTIGVAYALTYDLHDVLPSNIATYDAVFSKNTRIGSMVFTTMYQGNEFKDWWQTKNLETKYSFNRDERNFSVFLLRYFQLIPLQ